MKVILIAVLVVSVSCSHMDKVGMVGDIFSGSGSEASSAWKDLPRSLNDYLNNENSSVFVGRESQYAHQIDENMEGIYKDEKCYGPNGKKLDGDSLCREVKDLVTKIKKTRSELMNLHTKKISDDGNLVSAFSTCVENLQDVESSNLHEMKPCRSILSKYSSEWSKKSDVIRKHPRAHDLGVDKFDSFYFLNSSINEQMVQKALEVSSEKNESTLASKVSFENEQRFWSTYCMMVEAYKNGDEIIAAEPSPYRRQKLKNEMKHLPGVISMAKSQYMKNYGKPVDDQKCKKYQ